MNQVGHPGLVYGCITHVPLWIDFPSYVTPIYLGQAQGECRLNLRDLAPEWEPYHPILGGTVGSFALKNLVLRDHSDALRVGVCQYRKFVSRGRISAMPEPTYPVMDRVLKGHLGPERVAAAMDPGTQPFLVSRPFPHPDDIDVLTQYGRAHHLEDLLRFTAEAVELCVLDKDEVADFFHQTVFFPGGVELGVYPADFWIRSITAIEDVVRACVTAYPARRTDYQTRAWAFCAERLGSYLLLKYFLKADTGRPWARLFTWTQPFIWRGRHVGQMNLIVEQEGAGYTLGSMGTSA